MVVIERTESPISEQIREFYRRGQEWKCRLIQEKR
jgi:hypothetical protein